ncbi:hypothetical protein Tsubulata_006642 [Turnera subulata]|uniref:RING-type domain-containing protein n=1 Tax=Turnera subulata TaxID=218843 RepID=A0A9Q0FEV8_9ROSI|nr:hypothetical protein Tsubulata_006642 [Turnera subulata]
MGSGGSKGYCRGGASSSRTTSSSSSSKTGTTNSRRVFHTSCLGGAPCGSRPSNSNPLEEDEDVVVVSEEDENNNNKDKQQQQQLQENNNAGECYGGGKGKGKGKGKRKGHDHPAPSSLSHTEEEEEEGEEGEEEEEDSDASPPRFLSRFTFFPSNVSFRLSRAASLGSSRPHPHQHQHQLQEQQQPQDHPPQLDTTATSSSITDDGGVRLRPPPGDLANSAADPTRFSDRRISSSREPVERNVRFSRTLSVGRLRDRVLRRSSLSDHLAFCPLPQQEEDDAPTPTPLLLRDSTPPQSQTTPSSPHPPPPSNGIDLETSRSREARYHDLLEHRSNFLERRRRIRSQVRALQRLGSRFENLSGHERSCILSGQHRTGRCTCRIINRDTNLNDETSSRASISRIVMLAEALFEVLDEIHQQSVVLSSRPSVSSLGSVPAPKEVVESLPLRLYSKARKYHNEETAQCYICLVEYEEGDSMRVLPCHHEFHKSCVDKWLKEIHSSGNWIGLSALSWRYMPIRVTTCRELRWLICNEVATAARTSAVPRSVEDTV